MTERTAPIPQRVVLVVIDLAGGGTQKVVAGLARALSAAGCRVTIITNRTSDGRWSDVSDVAELIELQGRITTDRTTGAPPVVSNVRWLIGATRHIRNVVRSAGSSTPVLAFLPGTNVLTAAACIGLHAPLVLSERNDISRQPLSSALRMARRLLYRTASVVTTNRADDLAVLGSLAQGVPVRLVRNPPPRPTGRAQPSGSRVILCAGRLTAHKRHRDVIAAFGHLADEFAEWTLRILGDGPERTELERQVQRLGLEGRVELPGWSTEMAAELAKGALLVHASEYEGTSNAILEAMAVGLPVVVSAASHPTGSEESSSPTGIVHLPTGDVTALTGHLRVLLSSHGLRDAQGLSARDSVARLTADPLPEWLPVIDAALACSDRDGTH